MSYIYMVGGVYHLFFSLRFLFGEGKGDKLRKEKRKERV